MPHRIHIPKHGKTCECRGCLFFAAIRADVAAGNGKWKWPLKIVEV
jgi:coenzyme F420-reducing hydrogenase beta subunit